MGPVDEAGRVDPIVRSAREGDSVSGISEVVSESVRPPYVPSAKPLVWAPTTTPSVPTTLPTGQYMIVGAVVADVDGTPIYANKVLAAIEKSLATRAKELNEKAFRDFAADQIEKEVQTLGRDEVVYRAAQRALDENDRKLVDRLTTKWRQDKIIDAGGSVELARRKAKADSADFEQMVEDQHRYYMTQVYYEKKIIPLIVVTADMVREYYARNQGKLFTDKSAAKFRIIKIDSKEVGNRDRALARATEVQAKAAGGADFVALAHDNNKDSNLLAHDGLPMDGMIDRGAFANKQIEDAAWAMQPGQVSNVITVGDVFYIVKLEEKTVGRVKPFDSEEVQDQITQTLRREQFRVLREREEMKLNQNAIFHKDPKTMQLALDMAMQRYPGWKGN